MNADVKGRSGGRALANAAKPHLPALSQKAQGQNAQRFDQGLAGGQTAPKKNSFGIFAPFARPHLTPTSL